MDRENLVQLVDKIASGSNTEANELFDHIVSSRLSQAIDSKKQELAGSLFNSPETEEE